MKHARPDYQRIQDPAAIPELSEALDRALDVVAHASVRALRDDDATTALEMLTRRLHPMFLALRQSQGCRPIDDDEPVFLLRAQDKTAPDTVRAWADLQYRQGGNREMARLAMDHADAMDAWQQLHGAKVADIPADGAA